jgi:hypothetical protein
MCLRTVLGIGGFHCGAQASDRWEMRTNGPQAFERIVCAQSSEEHRPHVIGQLVSRMVENGAESVDSCRAFKTSLIQYLNTVPRSPLSQRSASGNGPQSCRAEP